MNNISSIVAYNYAKYKGLTEQQKTESEKISKAKYDKMMESVRLFLISFEDHDVSQIELLCYKIDEYASVCSVWGKKTWDDDTLPLAREVVSEFLLAIIEHAQQKPDRFGSFAQSMSTLNGYVDGQMTLFSDAENREELLKWMRIGCTYYGKFTDNEEEEQLR